MRPERLATHKGSCVRRAKRAGRFAATTPWRAKRARVQMRAKRAELFTMFHGSRSADGRSGRVAGGR
eukprot:5192654-Pyramimonas_sp.AAC.1